MSKGKLVQEIILLQSKFIPLTEDGVTTYFLWIMRERMYEQPDGRRRIQRCRDRPLGKITAKTEAEANRKLAELVDDPRTVIVDEDWNPLKKEEEKKETKCSTT